jgi:hypothetical protein
MKTHRKCWIVLGGMILLSPLGLILPNQFKAGSAWGEWSGDEMQKFVGYVPMGLQKLSNLWKPPMPDYGFLGWEEKGLTHQSLAYIVSGVVGALLVALMAWWIGKKLSKKD